MAGIGIRAEQNRRRAMAAFGACLLALAAIAAFAVSEPAQAAIPTVFNGSRDFPRVALTFDDNLSGPRSREVIRILERTNTKATIFVIASYAEAGPDLIKAIVGGGFEIGDHSRSHAQLPTLSSSALRMEIGGGTNAVRRLTGSWTAPLLRPPYGGSNARVAAVAEEEGFRAIVLWDVDTNDWRGRSAQAIRTTVLNETRNGSIVLMHLNAPHTFQALPGIIAGLRAKGFQLVTVTELLKGVRRYSDVDPKTPQGRAIDRALEAGLMEPQTADRFGSDDPMTLEDLGTLVHRYQTAAGSDSERRQAWTNIGAVKAQPASLTASTQARPVSRVNVARVLAWLARDLKGYRMVPPGSDPDSPPVFADVPVVEQPPTALAVTQGLIRATGTGKRSPSRQPVFDPWSTMTRGQVAEALDRLRSLPPQPGALSPFLRVYRADAYAAFGA
jgi:peptidoglycan/xylan/chitin deacetylase (PgdA/CDA1 family)